MCYLIAADTLNLFGIFNNDDECDYKPTRAEFDQIYQRPITQLNRMVCYDHPLCDDDSRIEGAEFFELEIVDTSASDVNVIIDSIFGTTTVIITDNDGELHYITIIIVVSHSSMYIVHSQLHVVSALVYSTII